MSPGYSDAQIAQLIADHAALKDEVAALRAALVVEHRRAVEETEDDWPVHLARPRRKCRICGLVSGHV